MKRIPWALSLIAGFLVTGLAMADTPQAIVMNVGAAASAGVVNFTLNAYDNSQLNVQTLVANGDTSAQVAAKIVATVTAMGGTTWSAQASFNGVPGAITFAYNAGSGWQPVSRITNLRNTASASMSLDTNGAEDVSLVFNAGASGGVNNTTLTLQAGGSALPYTLRLYNQTASQIVDGIATYLTNAGIGFTRSASNKIEIFPGPGAVVFTTNNPGLQGQVNMTDVWLATCGRGGTDK
jgi:hypothetical protein